MFFHYLPSSNVKLHACLDAYKFLDLVNPKTGHSMTVQKSVTLSSTGVVFLSDRRIKRRVAKKILGKLITQLPETSSCQ